MHTKLLIFGITGDLSRRKLLPALQAIATSGHCDELEVIGVSRYEIDVRQLLGDALGSQDLAGRVSSFTMDMTKESEYERLKNFVSLKDDAQLLIYLAVPPTVSTRIVDFLGQAGLNSPNVKLLFEKPFGVDLTSAEDMIARTARYFSEEQIYRIDHYLAKEMAQNIVVFRGSNAVFSNLWKSGTIEKIEVLATESIGIEGRSDFYEQTGALRDFVQGHLMQLLALVLMDIPSDFGWARVPALRLAALQAVRPADPAKVLRAQYEGYRDEVGNANSQVETFVRLELTSDNPRWQGVPLILMTGKALSQKTSEIRVHFKKLSNAQSNCLIFRIQPNEGIEIELFVKKPSYARGLEARRLEFAYPQDEKLPEAYEQVIVSAIDSDRSLFASGDEILRSWQILQPVQDAWDMERAPLPTYPKGSSADTLK